MPELPIMTIQKYNQEMKEDQETGGKQKKKVTFYTRVRRRFVESLLGEDSSMLWYSSKDYATAREKERSLRCYIQKTEQNEGNLNAQGILTLEEATRNRIHGRSAKSAVLEEQETQEIAFLTRNGRSRKTASFEIDGEQIAEAYRPYSQAALTQARHRAMTHEKYIHAILSNPTEELISAIPNRGRSPRLSLVSSPSSTRRRSPPLIRPGNRFPRSGVFIPGTPALVAGVTTPAAQ